MKINVNPKQGISTLVNHTNIGENAQNAHVPPIYQTSTFSFPDAETGAQIFAGSPGYVYTRWENPNSDQLAAKIAVLEGLDLLRAASQVPAEKVVAARMLSSGMAAVSTTILALVRSGQKIVAQNSLYSATYQFLCTLQEKYQIEVVFTEGLGVEDWKKALDSAGRPALVYAETPANPTMSLVDLEAVAALAHEHGAWLVVDNTFATPYCQRPLTLGADVVLHSTTKYLAGHGTTVGGVVVSRHPEFIAKEFYSTFKLLGGCPAPMDCWLTEMGLRTFELRMAAHCANAQKVAEFLLHHSSITDVYYPGLPSHPDHILARRQMHTFGGMVAFELKGGLAAGAWLMNHVRVATLAVSLGNADSLIQHPASMTHAHIGPEARKMMGISDGLVRFSVGIENIEDILTDLDQALSSFPG